VYLFFSSRVLQQAVTPSTISTSTYRYRRRNVNQYSKARARKWHYNRRPQMSAEEAARYEEVSAALIGDRFDVEVQFHARGPDRARPQTVWYLCGKNSRRRYALDALRVVLTMGSEA
jgi:hypothetical protein